LEALERSHRFVTELRPKLVDERFRTELDRLTIARAI
jgi:hypothetical protein